MLFSKLTVARWRKIVEHRPYLTSPNISLGHVHEFVCVLLTMAVNMAYVCAKTWIRDKSPEMTPPWNGSVDIALTSEKEKR
jgi:hypothetical protein